ncbi:hypothetical protein AVEN_261564-1 [Araneus ventricosus]|uniref:Uncharacterized protein n=1 Tax=Araneus ventricosus TaxID=182803 RepID=A0A4Y2ALS1_ARAVE|nr:hypothetical protein AVEN_261564-1 [Araneus ventricosus]
MDPFLYGVCGLKFSSPEVGYWSCSGGVSFKEAFDLESIQNDDSVSICEDTYANTVSRTEAGRHVVTLAFESPPELGNAETRALKCFYQVEGKLDRDSILKRQNLEFMREYLMLNQMELIPDSQVLNPRRYYLPHHDDRKDESTSTKLRVAFNASATDSEGGSLNDYL